MKRQYDYFEKLGGLVRLYRVPRSQFGPVEYSSTSSNGWRGSHHRSLHELWAVKNMELVPITAKRALEICNGNEVEVEPEAAETGPAYFWWQTASDVSPYLVRINPDNSVDSYIEPEHRNSAYWGPVLRSNGWASGVYTASEIRINSHVTPISEAEARQRRPLAFESSTVKWDGKTLTDTEAFEKFDSKFLTTPDNLEDYEYFTNDVDLYRRLPSAPDVFTYWCGWKKVWDEPCSSASEIVRMKQISAQTAQSLFPDAQLSEVEPVESLKVEIPLVSNMTIEYKYKGFGIEIAVVKLP